MNLEPKANQNIPELFWEIMRVQDEIDEVRARMIEGMFVVGNVISFENFKDCARTRKELLDPLLDRMSELREAAKKALSPIQPMGSGRPTAMQVSA